MNLLELQLLAALSRVQDRWPPSTRAELAAPLERQSSGDATAPSAPPVAEAPPPAPNRR